MIWPRHRLEDPVAVDGIDAADGAPFRRVLVPVESLSQSASALSLAARIGAATAGKLRLVHVRSWDPPMPRGGGRFYPESSEEATAILEAAMTFAWSRGAEASGVVVEAQSSSMGMAILAESAGWGADVIVLPSRPRPWLGLGLWEKAARQIERRAVCPVLLVYPGRT